MSSAAKRVNNRKKRQVEYDEQVELTCKLSQPIKTKKEAQARLGEWSALIHKFLVDLEFKEPVQVICASCECELNEMEFHDFLYHMQAEYSDGEDPYSIIDNIGRNFEEESKAAKLSYDNCKDFMAHVEESYSHLIQAYEDIVNFSVQFNCECETSQEEYFPTRYTCNITALKSSMGTFCAVKSKFSD